MIRNITLKVDKNAVVTNEGKDFAGVCLENGATSVVFCVAEELLDTLKANLQSKLYYRFELTDAQNKHYVLENQEAADLNTFKIKLTNAFTKCAGKLTVSLVFESGGDDGITLYTLPYDLKIEKGSCGITCTAKQTKTIVTAYEQAEKNIGNMLDLTDKKIDEAATETKEMLSEASVLCEKILSDSTNLSNKILNDAQKKADDSYQKAKQFSLEKKEEIGALLLDAENFAVNTKAEQQEILNNCEQRKTAAETAAINALEACKQAENAKADTKAMLDTKESLSNKVTNLMCDPYDNHDLYPSARATQDLINNFSGWVGETMANAHGRLEGMKADKTELEKTNAALDETKALLAAAKQEIEYLKAKDDYSLVADIVCDGTTANFTINNFGQIKKMFMVIRASSVLSSSLDFSCYANASSGVGNALIVTKANANTRWFRYNTERIANGIWKSETQAFSSAVYNSNWITTYMGDDINYIKTLYIKAQGTDGYCLPEGTTIKIYGIPV